MRTKIIVTTALIVLSLLSNNLKAESCILPTPKLPSLSTLTDKQRDCVKKVKDSTKDLENFDKAITTANEKIAAYTTKKTAAQTKQDECKKAKKERDKKLKPYQKAQDVFKTEVITMSKKISKDFPELKALNDASTLDEARNFYETVLPKKVEVLNAIVAEKIKVLEKDYNEAKAKFDEIKQKIDMLNKERKDKIDNFLAKKKNRILKDFNYAALKLSKEQLDTLFNKPEELAKFQPTEDLKAAQAKALEAQKKVQELLTDLEKKAALTATYNAAKTDYEKNILPITLEKEIRNRLVLDIQETIKKVNPIIDEYNTKVAALGFGETAEKEKNYKANLDTYKDGPEYPKKFFDSYKANITGNKALTDSARQYSATKKAYGPAYNSWAAKEKELGTNPAFKPGPTNASSALNDAYKEAKTAIDEANKKFDALKNKYKDCFK